MTQQITAQLLKGGLTVDASGNVTAIGRFSGPTQRTGTIKAQDGTTAITIADSTGVVTVTSPVINTGVSGSAILDEDAMGSNSATKLATQQSIKAYVDASGIPGISSTGATSSDTVTVAGNLTVNGTTTTLDTTLENVDKLEVGANSTDYGAKINQAGTGDILQLQDGSTTVFVVEDGGDVLPGADNTQDLGSTAKRWRNIYTTDLHLSNERGNWTVIEEENYLTLRNNKTDKVYKLVMEEIE